jgi:hypothetical protein
MDPQTLQWLMAYAEANDGIFPTPYVTSAYGEDGIWSKIKSKYPNLKQALCIPTKDINVVLFVEYLEKDAVRVYEYRRQSDGRILGLPSPLGMKRIGEIIHKVIDFYQLRSHIRYSLTKSFHF